MGPRQQQRPGPGGGGAPQRDREPSGGGGGGGSGSGGRGGGGDGMVDIPDAIPAELSYQVKYEGEDRRSGRAATAKDGLAVELAKSQDLRVRGYRDKGWGVRDGWKSSGGDGDAPGLSSPGGRAGPPPCVEPFTAAQL